VLLDRQSIFQVLFDAIDLLFKSGCSGLNLKDTCAIVTKPQQIQSSGFIVGLQCATFSDVGLLGCNKKPPRRCKARGGIAVKNPEAC
jgi:hypothetical protein